MSGYNVKVVVGRAGYRTSIYFFGTDWNVSSSEFHELTGISGQIYNHVNLFFDQIAPD